MRRAPTVPPPPVSNENREPSADAPSTTAVTTRIQTIKAMIEAGDYPLDLDTLAERIVDDEFLRAPAPGQKS